MFKPKLHSGPSFLIVLIPLAVFAQDPSESSVPLAAPSTAEKWEYFESETITPFTLGAGAFNAAVSQVTRSAPLYGRHAWPTAYPKRFGASVGDIVSQNFWGDFVLASAFHEDTRYRRRGESYQTVAAHWICGQPLPGHASGCGRSDVQLGERAWHRDERQPFQRVLSRAEPNARRVADQLGNQPRRVRPCESDARVPPGFQALAEAPSFVNYPGVLASLKLTDASFFQSFDYRAGVARCTRSP